MDHAKNTAVQTALTLGFDDVRFAAARGLPPDRRPSDDLACVAVLFKAYRPADAAPPGHMALSAYYAASHFAYRAASAFAARLTAAGARALHTAALPAKAAALLTGGFMGDNGFYYHPALGSLVCIQTVMTDAFAPDAPGQSAKACLHCGACARACPSGGVGDLQRCLRYHSGGLIPDALRGHVYQLLGCEKCQAACPQNARDKSAPHAFAIESLLDGSQTARLRGLAGAVMARRGRIVSQAALYAANTGRRDCAERLLALAQNEGEPVRTHARWAYDKLSEET